MKKEMENMTNKVSFITKIKHLSFSEPLTVKIPIIIIFKNKTRTVLLNLPNSIGPLIL